MPNLSIINLRSSEPNLALVLPRFPDKAETIRALASTNVEFREICEHYVLARIALKRLRRRSSEHQKPEVADYRILVAELERELLDYIAFASSTSKQ